MRSSAAIIAAAASTGMALPLLGNLGNILGGLSGGSDVVDEVPQTLTLLWTSVIPSATNSLTVLSGNGETAFAHTCGSSLTDDVFKAVPIDFSGLSSDGIGSFLYGDETHEVMSDATGAVSCVRQVTDATAVVQCVVPTVAGLALTPVGSVEDLATCMTSDLPLIGDLPALSGVLGLLP